MTRTAHSHSALVGARLGTAVALVLAAVALPFASTAPARATTVNVSGRILDIETGLPVTSVGSFRSMAAYGGLPVGPDGSFSLPVSTSDTRFRIDGVGEYVSQWYPGEYYAQGATPTTYDGTPGSLSGRNVYMSRVGSSTVCGRVVDTDGEPVYLGQVQAFRRVADGDVWAPVTLPGGVTGPRGEYAIAGLRPGTYRLGAAASMTDGCSGWFGGLTTETATSFVVPEATTVNGLTIRLDENVPARWPAEPATELPDYTQAAPVFGSVYEAVSGRPVPDVLMSTTSMPGSSRTDALGVFEVSARADWNAAVFCAADSATYFDGYFDAQDSALGAAAEASLLPATGNFGVQFLLNRKGTSALTGTALRADGRPAADVRLVVLQYATAFDVWDPVEREVTTDADGHFGIVGLSAGRYRVALRAAQGPTVGPVLLESADGAPAMAIVGDGAMSTLEGSFNDATGPSSVITSLPEFNAYSASPSIDATDVAWVSDVDAPDAPCGSGVAQVRVTVNGEPRVFPGHHARFELNDEGWYDVEYASVDVLGNVEETHTVRLAVDRTPPVSEPLSMQTTYTGDATFDFAGSDELSGYDTTWYALDGRDFQHANRLTVREPGLHTLAYFARDRAGLDGETHWATFFVTQPSRVVVEPGVRAASRYGDNVVLSGHVEFGSETDRVVAQKVVFERSASASGPWSRIAWPTDATESFQVVVPVTERTYVRISYPGAEGCVPSSTTVTLTTKASVPAPKTTASQHYRATYTVSGSFKPRHASSAPITLQYQRYQKNSAGKYGWVTRKTVKVYAKPSGSSMVYSTRVRLPYTGSWRVCAVHSDANHVATTGPYVSVKVR